MAVVLGASSAVWLNAGACGSSNEDHPFQDAAPDGRGQSGGSGGSSGRGGSGTAGVANGGSSGSDGASGSGTVGSSGSDGSSGSAGSSDAAGGATGGSGGDASADAATCASNCDDGVACTVDSCSAGICVHVVSTARCAAGSFCDLARGCIAYPACSTTQQCIDRWRDDACKSNVTCDAVSATCQFVVLDRDSDRHPPPVCGGDDCDDSRNTRFPGNSETCDGIDNDCDGIVDDQATCPQGFLCRTGRCVCPDNQQVCVSRCVNIATDEYNCGECGNICSASTVCNSGRCCEPNGGRCIDAGGPSCNPAFCPNPGTGTPCCVTPAGPCGINTGLGCADIRGDGGP
jgi:hypothetical protein